MKTITKSTITYIKNTFLAILVASTLFNCDSEEDVNLDTVFEPCESAIIFGLNTYNPWSGDTTLFVNADYGSETETAPAIGGSVTYSNASTYNYNLESYHFFNSSTNRFTNIVDTSPAEFTNLTGGDSTSDYSHLVYVSDVNQNYIIEHNSTGEIKLVRVNVDTGNIIGAPIATGIFIDTIISLSTTTNNENLVYIGVNNMLLTVNVVTGVLVSEALIEMPSTLYNFYGLEFNTDLDLINAVRIRNSNETDLVAINLDATYSVLYSLSSPGDIEDNNTIQNQFYSTSLNCDESVYIISYLQGNNNTFIQEVSLVTGEIITTYKEGSYYFGIESNANN